MTSETKDSLTIAKGIDFAASFASSGPMTTREQYRIYHETVKYELSKYIPEIQTEIVSHLRTIVKSSFSDILDEILVTSQIIQDLKLKEGT